MLSTGNLVAAIALSYLGATKGSKAHKQIIATYNEIKPHGYIMKLSDPWCAAFWTACQIKAGNTVKEVPMSASCSQIIADAKTMGAWKENEMIKPKIGWGVLYDWQDSGKGDNHGDPDHIGICYDVDDKYIYVVEGNKGSNSVVGKRAVKIDGRYLRGFVAPKYMPVAETDYKPTTPYDGTLPTDCVTYGCEGTSVKRLQKFLNWCLGIKLNGDGKCGKLTTESIIKFQATYGLKPDGSFGDLSRKKAQEIVKKHRKKKADPLQKWYDAMTTQYDWSKDQAYKWTTPTIKSSRIRGTCITFPAVALQRLKMLPSGGYVFYDPDTKKLAGSTTYIKKHTDWFIVLHPNKKPSDAELKKGDICCFKSHTMVYMGKDSKGRTRWNTMGNKKRGLNVTYPSYDKQKVIYIVRIKKVR